MNIVQRLEERITDMDNYISHVESQRDGLLDALFKIMSIEPAAGCSRADLSLAFGEAQKIANHAFITRGIDRMKRIKEAEAQQAIEDSLHL